jgi:hypothetical protein
VPTKLQQGIWPGPAVAKKPRLLRAR